VPNVRGIRAVKNSSVASATCSSASAMMAGTGIEDAARRVEVDGERLRWCRDHIRDHAPIPLQRRHAMELNPLTPYPLTAQLSGRRVREVS
jgi:hypothetical protein